MSLGVNNMDLLVVLLPGLGSFIAGCIAIYNKNNNNANYLNFVAWLISTFLLAATALLACLLLIKVLKQEEALIVGASFNWFVSGNLLVNFSFLFDVFTTAMIVLVSFVSFLVHFYSYFYMSKNDNLARFQSYLSLFTFSMILLISSGNLVQMFIGWELISFCSYLLIVFWYNSETTNSASIKAFLVNRFADIGFLLGTFAIFTVFGSVQFKDIYTTIDQIATVSFNLLGLQIYYIDFIAICFLITAFAKSAQLLLHVWLPDAMEAPTPVSALLHAATMVTAGVFLLIKLAPIYELSFLSKNIILIISSLSAVYASLVACFQRDIKKIIAYSTMSQLAYMFLAIAVSAYSAAFFHLFTHAFFKALLFLGAGSIIHAMNGEQDIKKMGNLWRKMPITYICMLIGSLALIGIPGFSGFYSKEAILNYIYLESDISIYVLFAYYSAMLSVFFTAFYSLRLLINVFHSSENYDVNTLHVHESPIGILFVLIILAILSVITGNLLFDRLVGERSSIIWRLIYFPVNPMLKEDLNHNIEYITIALAAIALIFVYLFYIRDKMFSSKLKKNFPNIYSTLINKFYFDELYQNIIVKPYTRVSYSLRNFDDNIFDKYTINALASIIFKISRLVSKWQTGFVNLYAVVMVLGLFLILTYYFIYWGFR